jgi:hypothetical protein
MPHLTDTDFSRLVLFARLKNMDLEAPRPDVRTALAKRLADDLERGEASEGNEAEFNRVQRLAVVG